MSNTSTTAAIRFGYGLSFLHPSPGDGAAILAGVTGPDIAARRFPVAGMPDLRPLMRDFAKARTARKRDEPGADAKYKAARKTIRNTATEGIRAHLMRAVYSPDGFRERLQFFWADHFTVRSKSVAYAATPTAFVEEAIRPHLGGSFRDMLRAATTHPAMLAYLDQTTSIGPKSRVGQRRDVGLNENLARELLELHTLGVEAGYTQTDVVELAELLTGLSFNAKAGFKFRAAWAEPGAERVLGQSYGGRRKARLEDILAALDDIAAHPDTAAHLARKLAVHFVSDDPDPGLVADLTAAWRASDGDLPSVYAALLDHPAAWAEARAKARQPWDFVVAGLRALGTPENRIAGWKPARFRKLIGGGLVRMGQLYQRPPGPDGWPEAAEAWITPPALAERINWAMNISQVHGTALPDARVLVTTALGGTASDRLVTAVRRSESNAAAVGLVLASSEFNRR